MKKTKQIFLAFFLIFSLVISPSSGYAQGDADETVYLGNGDVKRILVNGHPDEYIIRVYKNDGTWDGQKITARGRLTAWNCDYDLYIFGSYPRDGGAVTSFNTSNWSGWAVLTYSQQYIEGYSEDNFFDITLIQNESNNENTYGYCWTSDPYDVEIEIWLVESELPPTEPPATEPPATEPPATEPPATEPPATTQMDFWADTYQIKVGECSTLHWNVQNGTAYWNDESTFNAAKIDVCPRGTTTYTLKVWGEDGKWHNQSLTIYVEEPIATLTPPSTSIPISTPPVTPYVLVVTHSANLNTQVNKSDAWDKIKIWLEASYTPLDIIDLFADGISSTDQAAIATVIQNRIQTYSGNPNYLLIIGGPAVVAFGELPNPMWGSGTAPNIDYDILYTDDVYADTVADTNNAPDIPIARLPDGGDFGMYEFHFGQKQISNAGYQGTNYQNGYAFGRIYRPYAKTIGDLIQAPETFWVPPTAPGSWLTGLWGRNIYFILHGDDGDATQWWGEYGGSGALRTYPVGWTRDYSSHWENVVSGACYGGFLGTPSNPKRISDSISLSFLSSGTKAFMGYTISSYSIMAQDTTVQCANGICSITIPETQANVQDGDAYLGYTAYQAIMAGDTPIDAFWKAKIGAANSLGPGSDFNSELKNLHGFHFYGLPPANASPQSGVSDSSGNDVFLTDDVVSRLNFKFDSLNAYETKGIKIWRDGRADFWSKYLYASGVQTAGPACNFTYRISDAPEGYLENNLFLDNVLGYDWSSEKREFIVDQHIAFYVKVYPLCTNSESGTLSLNIRVSEH